MNVTLLPRELQSEIYVFNLHPFAYADQSWLASSLLYNSLHRWEGLPFASQELSVALLEMQKLPPNRFLSDFQNPLYELALVGNWPVIVKLTGAAFSWPQIRSVVQGKEVQRLKSILGKVIYNFALKRGPYLFPHSKGASLPSNPNLHERIFQQRGLQVWQERFSFVEQSQLIWPRLQLKLPRQLVKKQLKDNHFVVTSTANLLKMIKEVFPQWQKSRQSA